MGEEREMSDFASHYASLPDDDLLRLTADVADLLPEAREALKTETQKRNLSTESIDWNAQPPAPTLTLPYSWGKFQGWAMLICGIFAFFVMVGKGNVLGIVTAPFNAYTGFALIKRKRHGIILFYVGTGIAALCALFVDIVAVADLFTSTAESAENAGYLLGQAIALTLVIGGLWVIPALFYYRKRLPEFRKTDGETEIRSL
jgi:hypothetical protein